MENKYKKIKYDSAIKQSSSLEHNMLPPQFRRRSRFPQRAILLLIVSIYSFAIGATVFFLLGSVKTQYNIATNSETTYFLIAIMILVISLLINPIYVFWSRTKTYIISLYESLCYLISPLIAIGGLIFLSKANQDSSVSVLIGLISYITFAMGASTGIFVLGKNLLLSRKYREAKYRTLYTILGLIISSSSSFIFYMTMQGDGYVIFKWNHIIKIGSIFIGGILIMALGMALSSKYIISGEKNIWASIRYISGLPSLALFSIILAVAFENSYGFAIISPLYIHIGICGFLIFIWIIYLFKKARIKNMGSTNPLYNEIFLKLFISIILISTLVMTFLLPALSKQKSYGEYSYIILAVGAGSIIIGIIFAHFMNLITYTKYSSASILGVIVSMFLIYAISLAIASLKSSEVISHILGRQLAITFLIIITVFQLSSLVYNMIYIFLNSVKKSKEILIDDNNKIISQSKKRKRLNNENI